MLHFKKPGEKKMHGKFCSRICTKIFVLVLMLSHGGVLAADRHSRNRLWKGPQYVPEKKRKGWPWYV